MHRLLSAIGLLVLAGASGASAQVTGRYSFVASSARGDIPGEIEITGNAPGYGGMVRWTLGSGPDSARVIRVTPEGTTLTVIGENSAGNWTFQLAFAGDVFTGTHSGVAAGSLTGQRSAAGADPTGVYDVMLSVGARSHDGRLVIRGTPGAYTGSITPTGATPAEIKSVTVTGPDLTVVGSLSEGTVTLRLRMQGDSIKGKFEMSGGDAGDFTGVRIRR